MGLWMEVGRQHSQPQGEGYVTAEFYQNITDDRVKGFNMPQNVHQKYAKEIDPSDGPCGKLWVGSEVKKIISANILPREGTVRKRGKGKEVPIHL